MAGMERVLFTCREVGVFKIPPRAAAGGYKSGDWRVDDKIFTARCRVIERDDDLEVRLEDSQTGELFGTCPVPPGRWRVAVEPAADSSRNFVVRLEDPVSKRHAFLGVNFTDRSSAFDFTVALSDHEKQQQRAQTLQTIRTADDPQATAARALPEAAALYKKQDLSLEQGTTIRLNVKKPAASSGAGGSSRDTRFLSRLPSPGGGSGSGLVKLALPPAPGTKPMALAGSGVTGQAAAAPAAGTGWATFE